MRWLIILVLVALLITTPSHAGYDPIGWEPEPRTCEIMDLSYAAYPFPNGNVYDIRIVCFERVKL